METLPVVIKVDQERLLTDLLRSVSRTFYLTLRILPKGLREPIGLAYLLARVADTIADTRLLPQGERLRHLITLREQVEGPASMSCLQRITMALTDRQPAASEQILVTSLPEALSILEGLPGRDRMQIRLVVATLTQGMEIDLTKFPSENAGQIEAFKTAEELDQYIYYVAGCVGEFWTAMTMDHTVALRGWDKDRMAEKAIRFGKALQLTNVLRDVPSDLRIGRCYLPQDVLTQAGVAPHELLDPAVGWKARPVLVGYIEKTLDFYQSAEDYLIDIPRQCVRLRLAVLWPMLIGLATLGKLARNEGWLDPARPSKISRMFVYGKLTLSLPCVFSNGLLRAWIRRLREIVKEAL